MLWECADGILFFLTLSQLFTLKELCEHKVLSSLLKKERQMREGVFFFFLAFVFVFLQFFFKNRDLFCTSRPP